MIRAVSHICPDTRGVRRMEPVPSESTETEKVFHCHGCLVEVYIGLGTTEETAPTSE